MNNEALELIKKLAQELKPHIKDTEEDYNKVIEIAYNWAKRIGES